MNRLVRGSVMLAAVAFVWACGGDPTADEAKTIVKLTADPAFVIVSNTDSQAVIVEAVNSLDQQDAATFSQTAAAGLTVSQDTAYGRFTNGDVVSTRVRYFVKPSAINSFVSSSFTVTGAGKTLDIPVKIYPASLPANFSNATPNVGDTVTLTLPANLHFTSATRVTFADTAQKGAIVSISADSTSADMVFGPNVTGVLPARFSHVIATYLPTADYTAPATGSVMTPSFPFSPTFGPRTSLIGDTVTLTMPTGYKLSQNSNVTFNSVPGLVASVAADSSSLKFIPEPGSKGIGGISAIIVPQVPQLRYGFFSSDTIAASTTVVGTTFGVLPNAVATAPVINIRPSGGVTGFIDGGTFGYAPCAGDFGDPCRLYKFTLADSTDIDIDATWSNTSDLGVYFYASDAATLTGNFDCDAHGTGSTAKPETCTQSLPAGTYYMVVVHFVYSGSTNVPTWWRVRMTTH